MTIVQKENDFLKFEIKKSEHSRQELQSSIKETIEEIKSESFNLQKNYSKIMNEKVMADEKNKEANQRIDNLNQQIEKKNFNILALEKDLSLARDNIKCLE